MRAESALRLASDPALAAGLRRSTADLLAVAARADAAMTALRPDLAGALDDPVRAMTGRLELLSGEPETIVHGDFQAKNLLSTPGGGIVTVDWSDAYVHPHLGDLYLLLREGRKQGRVESVRIEALPELFAHEAGTDPRVVTDQLVTGGLCWTMNALRWVVEIGVHAVPVSREWIDELVTDLRGLAAIRVAGSSPFAGRAHGADRRAEVHGDGERRHQGGEGEERGRLPGAVEEKSSE
ncbi:hypothetical protein DMB66_04690 [Actinoplanes sp. ATCC 53533]|nr:hypothetical protein DMB66_04690 [Actinoplanes sp. ATCC 53533]